MNTSDENKNDQAAGKAAPKKPSVIERFRHMHIAMDDMQANRSLKITGLVLLSLLCLFVLVKTINEVKAYNTIGEAPAMPYSITVNGHGEATAKRDTTSLSFTSQGKGKTALEAQSKAAEANNKAIDFLKTKGIAEADISNDGYNTYPTYDQKVKPCVVSTPDAAVRSNGGVSAGSAGSIEPAMAPTVTIAPIAPCSTYEQVITGYETTQTIRVKIRGIDKNPALPGEIVDGLAAAGVQVGSLTNSIDETEALQSQARAEAIMKARVEARRIAKSLGVRVTKVVSYYENNYGYPMAEAAMSSRSFDAGKSVAPYIPGGEGKITSDVSVTFEIR